jgi:hypothetical protein
MNTRKFIWGYRLLALITVGLAYREMQPAQPWHTFVLFGAAIVLSIIVEPILKKAGRKDDGDIW